jgi:glycerophosphoryl diester phosphodiesterase
MTLSELRKINTNKKKKSKFLKKSFSSHNFSDIDINDNKIINEEIPEFKKIFEEIESEIGFDIEVKYPMSEESKKHNMTSIIDRNSYVDIILKTVFDHVKKRNIFFSSFDADICLLLHLKQPIYPVLFLTECGLINYIDQRYFFYFLFLGIKKILFFYFLFLGIKKILFFYS